MKKKKIPVTPPEEPIPEDVEIPEGWKSLTLEDFVYIAARIGWRGLKREEYTKEGPLFLAVKDIQENGYIDFLNVTAHLSEYRYDESPEIQLREHDIIITKDGTIGKIGYVKNLPGKVTVNSSLLVVRPSDDILPRFLFHYFRSPSFQKIVQGRITGSAVPHLFQKDIKKFQILMPPLDEQQRIVTRIEALLAHVNEARGRLQRVPGIMKQFRQGVLAAACSGKLTEGWREENQEKLSASDVAEYIELHVKRKSNNIMDKGDFPDTWIPVIIGDLFENWGGATPSTSEPSFWGGNIPWVSSKDIKSSRITQGSDFITNKALEGSRLRKSPKGSVLVVVRSGVLAHTFPVAVTDAEAVINQDIKAFFTPNQALNEWLALFFRGQSQYILENIRKDGTTVQSIRFDELKKMVLLVPAFEEQHEIVRRVDALFARAEAVERDAVAATKRAEALTQAVLARAFAGKL